VVSQRGPFLRIVTLRLEKVLRVKRAREDFAVGGRLCTLSSLDSRRSVSVGSKGESGGRVPRRLPIVHLEPLGLLGTFHNSVGPVANFLEVVKRVEQPEALDESLVLLLNALNMTLA